MHQNLVRLTILIGGSGVVLLLACGSFGTADSPSGQDAGSDASRVGTEAPTTQFPCGSNTKCNVGEQACCVFGGTFACVSAIDGCGGDGGDGGGVKLLCTSYTDCGGEECCWRPDLGSKCERYCRDGYASLCSRAANDGCGRDYRCDNLPNDPLGPGIGECERESSGGSSGGSGGSGSSGYSGGSGGSNGPW